MRIFLQDKKIGMYYAHPDRWSANAAEAFDFHNADYAMQVARSYALSATEIVYFLKDADLNFSISVPD